MEWRLQIFIFLVYFAFTHTKLQQFSQKKLFVGTTNLYFYRILRRVLGQVILYVCNTQEYVFPLSHPQWHQTLGIKHMCIVWTTYRETTLCRPTQSTPNAFALFFNVTSWEQNIWRDWPFKPVTVHSPNRRIWNRASATPLPLPICI